MKDPRSPLDQSTVRFARRLSEQPEPLAPNPRPASPRATPEQLAGLGVATILALILGLWFGFLAMNRPGAITTGAPTAMILEPTAPPVTDAPAPAEVAAVAPVALEEPRPEAPAEGAITLAQDTPIGHGPDARDAPTLGAGLVVTWTGGQRGASCEVATPGGSGWVDCAAINVVPPAPVAAPALSQQQRAGAGAPPVVLSELSPIPTEPAGWSVPYVSGYDPTAAAAATPFPNLVEVPPGVTP